MMYLYLQTISIGKKGEIPFRITFKNDVISETIHYLFRPSAVIPKKVYETLQLDRMELVTSPPFCDIADELIEIFQDQQLVFSEARQFQLLKAQFRTIGYNFNLRPTYLFHEVSRDKLNVIEMFLNHHRKDRPFGCEYANAFVELMGKYHSQAFDALPSLAPSGPVDHNFELSQYKMAPGVYYFLDEHQEVIYVGKAKSLRKRLQSHFSKQTSTNNIDYSKVKSITVEYSGNDLLAQLMESADIKALQPRYNTQQVHDPAPYIINRGKTAKGIHKLQITRKDIKDNMPEKYFNRSSVKISLENFCSEYQLCRKHCGLEQVKGPCSIVTVKNQPCVCAGSESMETYNFRFDIAFYNFQNQKTRKIYKLKGRHKSEDAFIYLVNGIYEGYGFIDKSIPIPNINDILGHLTVQTNNYDTSRIVSQLDNIIASENILDLSDLGH